jgi:hypothetical protein
MSENISRGEGYLSDILWSYHLSLDFPKFYEGLRDINLENEGSINLTFYWRDVYLWCNELKEFDFLKGNFTYDSYAKLSAKIAQIFGREYDNVSFNAFRLLLIDSMCLYILFKRTSHEIVPIDYLYIPFLLSSDIYDAMITPQDFVVYVTPNSLTFMKSLHQDKIILESFMSDLREKLGFTI